MKRILLPLFVLGICTIANAQLQNGGFSSWTTNSYVRLPWPVWSSSNSGQIHDDKADNVAQSTDSHSGTYAAKLTNSVDDGGDLNSGVIATKLSQLPTSFSLWIKSNCIAGDATAAVLYFTKGDETVGMQTWELPGTSLAWSKLTCNVATPSFAYDEIMLVVFASKLSSYDPQTMAGFIGTYALVDDIEVTGATITNNGLETWETVTSEVPDNWTIRGANYFNSYVSPNAKPVQKVADGHTGSAIKITTTPDDDEHAYEYSINELRNKFAWTSTSLTGKVTGYYKYIPKVAGEKALAAIQFLDKDGLGMGYAGVDLAASDVYTKFEFIYNILSVPVSAELQIMASSNGVNAGNAGTVLFVDDIEVVTNITGVDANRAGLPVSVSPNPCSDKLTVTLNDASAGTVQADIYDLAGNLVGTTTANGAQQSFSVNTTGIANGVYVLKLTSLNGVTTTRFVKK